jgi:hypothetical protein
LFFLTHGIPLAMSMRGDAGAAIGCLWTFVSLVACSSGSHKDAGSPDGSLDVAAEATTGGDAEGVDAPLSGDAPDGTGDNASRDVGTSDQTGGMSDAPNGHDATNDDARNDVPLTDGSAPACGTSTCLSTQVCVHPCCGGVAPQCTARPEGGVCPAGSDPVASCFNFSGPACKPAPCVTAPPRCVDLPTGCSGAPACGCLPDVCSGGACGTVSGRDVTCGCA